MDTDLFVRVLGALFAVMNPFVNLPFFLSLTSGSTPAEMRKTALATVFYSAILAAAVLFGGNAILTAFGITVHDFSAAGGLVLLLIALNMLNGQESSAHHGTAGEQAQQAEHNSIAFYPMAFPMILGPGTITTVLVFLGQAPGVTGMATIGVALAAILLLLGVVLYFAATIGKLMSQTLRTIMMRLMGMILAAIAIDMIAGGLKALLPGLA